MNAGSVVRVVTWCRSGALAVGAAAARRLARLHRHGRRLLISSCRGLALLLRLLALATAMVIALQLAHLSQSLATIAQAQAITGFAVMRSLQAHAERTPGVPPPPGATAAASAIDASRLESATVAHGP